MNYTVYLAVFGERSTYVVCGRVFNWNDVDVVDGWVYNPPINKYVEATSSSAERAVSLAIKAILQFSDIQKLNIYYFELDREAVAKALRTIKSKIPIKAVSESDKNLDYTRVCVDSLQHAKKTYAEKVK